jgi:hypothetical protein
MHGATHQEATGRPSLIREPARQGEAVHFLVKVDPAVYVPRLTDWARRVQLRYLAEAARSSVAAPEAFARFEDAKKAEHQAEQVRAQAERHTAAAHQERANIAAAQGNLNIDGNELQRAVQAANNRAGEHERAAAHYRQQHEAMLGRADQYRQRARQLLAQVATEAAERAADEVERVCRNHLERWVALCPGSALFAYEAAGPQIVVELTDELERVGAALAVPPSPAPRVDATELFDRVNREAGGIMYDGSNAAQVQQVIDRHFRERGLPAPSSARPAPPPQGDNGFQFQPVPFHPEWPPPAEQPQQRPMVAGADIDHPQFVTRGPDGRAYPTEPPLGQSARQLVETVTRHDPGLGEYIRSLQAQAPARDYAEEAIRATEAQVGPRRPNSNAGPQPGLPPGFRPAEMAPGPYTELGDSDFPV